MESIGPDRQASAAEFLTRQAEIRARVEDTERLGSRGYSWLMLATALLSSVYVVILLSALSASGNGAPAGGYMYLLLLPVLLFSSLINGAKDRFAVRRKYSIAGIASYTVAFAAFAALGILAIGGAAYPWWLNVVVGVAVFAAIGASPLRRLWSSRRVLGRKRWRTEALAAPARWTTVAIGIVLATLAATSSWRFFPTVASAIVMVSLTAFLIGWRAPWGLPRTGYDWGPVHWAALGAVTAVLFALAAAAAAAAIISPAMAAGAGAVILAFMLFSALFRPRSDRR
jgi:hypothetical protein